MIDIYKMAEDAAEFAVLNPSEDVLQSECGDVKIEIPKAFIDKFVELIIQDCVDVAHLEGDDVAYLKNYIGVENA